MYFHVYRLDFLTRFTVEAYKPSYEKAMKRAAELTAEHGGRIVFGVSSVSSVKKCCRCCSKNELEERAGGVYWCCRCGGPVPVYTAPYYVNTDYSAEIASGLASACDLTTTKGGN